MLLLAPLTDRKENPAWLLRRLADSPGDWTLLESDTGTLIFVSAPQTLTAALACCC